jgi:FecR protein
MRLNSTHHFKPLRHQSFVLTGVLFALTLLLLINSSGVAQQSVRVRVDRWLTVQQLSGTVMLRRSNGAQAARVGDRLLAVGDGISTGANSNAVLVVDTGIGFVTVSENTQMTVRLLSLAPDDGRITHLDVASGQVRLRLRPFTNRGSELQIRTPAGISAVRGTEFGVNVQPSGKTGVATLTGDVETSAQNQRVSVSAGFQNLTIPGEPPTPATPLQDSTELRYVLELQIERNLRYIQLNAEVDPVNTVLVGNTPQNTDREGRFSLRLPAVSRQRLEITVITPLGRQQVHQLVIRP